jgi:hypothetical protein
MVEQLTHTSESYTECWEKWKPHWNHLLMQEKLFQRGQCLIEFSGYYLVLFNDSKNFLNKPYIIKISKSEQVIILLGLDKTCSKVTKNLQDLPVALTQY